MPQKQRAKQRPPKHHGKRVTASGSPKSQFHQGTTVATAGWTVDDTHDPNFGTTGTRSSNPSLGRYKRSMPRNRTRYVQA